MQKYKFLFIDASKQFHELTRTVIHLEQLPVTAKFVLGPKAALRYLKDVAEDKFPDAIIADHRLPFYRGHQFFECIENVFPSQIENCALYLSASSAIDLNILDTTTMPHVTDLVAKPFSRSVYQRCVKGILRKRSLATSCCKIGVEQRQVRAAY